MDKRRLRSFIIMGGTIVATPFYSLCAFTHVCMCGHLRHQPLTKTELAVAAVWMGGCLLGVVGTWRSDMPLRPELAIAFVLLILLRALFGLAPHLELPVLVFVVATTGARLLFPARTQAAWGGHACPPPTSSPAVAASHPTPQALPPPYNVLKEGERDGKDRLHLFGFADRWYDRGCGVGRWPCLMTNSYKRLKSNWRLSRPTRTRL